MHGGPVMEPANTNQSANPFTRKWTLVVILCTLPLFFLCAYLGYPGKGRAAGISTAAIMFAGRDSLGLAKTRMVLADGSNHNRNSPSCRFARPLDEQELPWSYPFASCSVRLCNCVWMHQAGRESDDEERCSWRSELNLPSQFFFLGYFCPTPRNGLIGSEGC